MKRFAVTPGGITVVTREDFGSQDLLRSMAEVDVIVDRRATERRKKRP
jgi:hypothetical protein